MAIPSAFAAQSYDVEGHAPGGHVLVRAWLPDCVPIRGVVVMSPGVGGDERGAVDDPAWQEAAAKWRFALAGTKLEGGPDYNNASSGTGPALDSALVDLANKSGHAEIATAPLCLVGFSNGGAFSFSYNWYRPDRVIAFFCNKSGLAKDGGDRRANQTFAILLYGEKEQGGPRQGSQAKMGDYFLKHRSQGARWALATEWGAMHERGKVDPFVRAFFEQAIAMRYPESFDPRKGPVALREFPETSGWIGDNGSWQGLVPQTMPFARFHGDLSKNSWLPNADVAQDWAAFVAHKVDSRSRFYTDWPFDSREAAKRQDETAHALGIPREAAVDVAGSEPLKLTLIPAGRYLMGSDPADGLDRDESPRHEVLLTRAFYMATCTVTQTQYRAVMGKDKGGVPTTTDSDTEAAAPDPRLPATEVAWYDAAEFCTRLSATTGRTVRLPTEAEWEYACRAGTATPYYTGHDLAASDARFRAEGQPVGPAAVGSYPANAWGLYDMAGNVCEWCADWYGDYPAEPQRDPTGPETGLARVIRGGGWFTDAWYCRSAYRRPEEVWYGRINDLGFRVVVEIPGAN